MFAFSFLIVAVSSVALAVAVPLAEVGSRCNKEDNIKRCRALITADSTTSADVATELCGQYDQYALCMTSYFNSCMSEEFNRDPFNQASGLIPGYVRKWCKDSNFRIQFSKYYSCYILTAQRCNSHLGTYSAYVIGGEHLSGYTELSRNYSFQYICSELVAYMKCFRAAAVTECDSSGKWFAIGIESSELLRMDHQCGHTDYPIVEEDSATLLDDSARFSPSWSTIFSEQNILIAVGILLALAICFVRLYIRYNGHSGHQCPLHC